MAFSRDDLAQYETKPQTQVENHDFWAPPQAGVKAPKVENPPRVEAEADVNAAIDASITEPTEKGTNDGSTTETEAESVAAQVANPEGAKDPELDELADGKPRSRAQERIEELVAERNALRKYGEYLLSQVESQRQTGPKGSTQESRPVAAQVAEEPAPTLETADFDPIKLSRLQNEWIQKQVDKRVESAVQQLATRQDEVATRQAFEQRTVEFRKTAPDFTLVIGNPALPSLAADASRVIVKSESGPAILYHLGKNPDLAARIARMEPSSQAAAVGRIEEQLARSTESKTTQKEPSNPAPAIKQVAATKAPPPMKPVTSGTGVISKDITQMTMEEWVAHERGRKVADRQARQKMRQSMR